MDPTRVAEIWARLLTGKALDDLRLPKIGDRLDLRGLVASEPSVLRQYLTSTATVRELSDVVIIRGANWKGIDFSNSRLDSLRFFNSSIEDCSFDGAHCQDWRLWGVTISNSTFHGADLRKSALGGVKDGKRNSFRRVDFTKADLRETVYVSGHMLECRFVNSKLAKLDFQGTVFVDCIFVGELQDVLFYRRAFQGEAFPPNEMEGVDFRRARLRHVEFRELAMGNVLWPEDDEHIVLKNYVAALDRMLNVLKARSDIPSKRLAAMLELKRKWAGQNQRQGVLSKPDLIEAGGEEAVAELLRLLS